MDIGVFPQVKRQGQQRAADLADDSGQGCTRHLHPWETEQAKDQDGVQDDVDDGPGGLGDHGVKGPPGGLEDALQGDLGKHTKAHTAADSKIVPAIAYDRLDVRLDGVEPLPAGQTEEHKHQTADGGQQKAVHGRPVHLVLLLLAQTAGEQGVDAHAGAHAHRDHQILHRKCQGHGVQRILAELGHEHAVHHVIKGLDQHRYDHGHSHVQQQPIHRHDTHFIFSHVLLQIFFLLFP